MCCCGVTNVAAEGLLVAVEGIDRSGKTTLVAALRDVLAAAGFDVVSRREPSRGPIGTFFRRVTADAAVPAVSAALLSAADRHEQQAALRAQLTEHRVVLSDRYYLSGLAYHLADGIDPDFYRSLNHGIRRPDLYLHLAVAPAIASSRGDPLQGRWEQPAFTAALPSAYARCIALLSDTEEARFVDIDAAQPSAHVLTAAVAAVETLAVERN